MGEKSQELSNQEEQVKGLQGDRWGQRVGKSTFDIISCMSIYTYRFLEML